MLKWFLIVAHLPEKGCDHGPLGNYRPRPCIQISLQAARKHKPDFSGACHTSWWVKLAEISAHTSTVAFKGSPCASDCALLDICQDSKSVEAEHPLLILRYVENKSNLEGDRAVKLLPSVCWTLIPSTLPPTQLQWRTTLECYACWSLAWSWSKNFKP